MKIKNISCLVIIDQQKGITYPSLGQRNNENAESEMLRLLAKWRSLGWPIFHVKHRSSQVESVFWPHQEGFEFREEFEPLDGEFIIEKQTPCAFTHTELETILNKKKINTIVVVGASTNNSVEATVRNAACKGFTVIVIENACFTFAKKDFNGVERTAEDVHAMSLANLNNEYASIRKASEFY